MIDGSLHQSCYHHNEREAAARCPACRHFFCRECVTEHDDRMLCSACLSRISGGAAGLIGARGVERLAFTLQGLFGFGLLWYLFFLLGRMLMAIPHDFHEGTIWQIGGWFQP